jgi:hypothetical protein
MQFDLRFMFVLVFVCCSVYDACAMFMCLHAPARTSVVRFSMGVVLGSVYTKGCSGLRTRRYLWLK